MSVYRRHLDSVRAAWPASVIELSDNFRSHSDVLAFVDCVFEKPGMFGGEFMSLAAGRAEAEVRQPFSDAEPRVVVQHTSRPWRGVDGAAAIEVAAGRIADHFAHLAAAGHAPREMVVLLGRMSHADVYARALRNRGLPCVVAGGSVFAQSLEAQVADQLVRVIANPLETQALFNVLTSPLFALTAGDLLQAGGVKGFWHATAEVPDGASSRLACALRVMADVRRSIGRMPVARLLERAVVDAGWLSRLQTQGAEGLASAGNVFKAVRMVHAIERGGVVGPAAVARRFAAELASSKEAPGALSVSGGDSVSIMTVHASKGLEFPIVAVAEMKENRAPSSRLLVSAVAGKVYLSLDLGRTLNEVGDTVDAPTMTRMRDYVLGQCAGEDELAAAVAEDAGALHRRLALREYAAAGDGEEAKRLLYVAITRAKEAVVVSSVGVRTKDNPLGVPKSAMAGVFAALDPTGAAIGEGRSSCDYGGTRPAVVECVALSADSDGVQSGPPCDAAPAGMAGRDCALAGGSAEPSFAVPAAEAHDEASWEPFSALREGVFSYSSLSDASHGGDVLERLADRFFVSADSARGDCDWPAADDAFAATRPPAPASKAGMPPMAHGYPDDDFWDFDPTQAFDEDRATDLGTAFHRLAQYAVAARGDGEALVMPPADRIEALSRTCNLDAEQRMRLAAALDRWFACDVAHEMAALAGLSAEVPFFAAVPIGAGEQGYLEGEIDLLGFDDGRSRAVVVDYKTGGHADEPVETLRCKHVLQASCYAYAIMLQGASEVEAVFVRVERPRADDDTQPQCVRYHFASHDMPQLAHAIAEAYSRAETR